MTVCAVKCCKNYSAKKEKCINITFHRIPTDPVEANLWTNIIRRTRNEPTWKPKPNSTICSAHFHTRDTYITKGGLRRIRSGAVPTKYLYISSKMDEDDTETDCSNNEFSSDHHNVLDEHKNEDVQTEMVMCDEPSTSIERKSENSSPLEINQEEPEICSSDLDSIYDSPRKAKLRKDLRRARALQIKHAKKIKVLQQQNRRLKKRNIFLRRALKRQRYIDNGPFASYLGHSDIQQREKDAKSLRTAPTKSEKTITKCVDISSV